MNQYYTHLHPIKKKNHSHARLHPFHRLIGTSGAMTSDGAFWFCTYEEGLNAERFVELLGQGSLSEKYLFFPLNSL
jgi:hypothetical protein